MRGGSRAGYQRPGGVRIIAAVVAAVSLRLLFFEAASDGLTDSWAGFLGTDPVLATLTLVTVGAGGVVTLGLWSARPWALSGYGVWAALYLVVAFVSDMRVEPVGWKMVVGALPLAVLTAVGGACLYRSRA